MDREQVYEFLLSADRPMTIGEINAQPQFRGVERRELAMSLRALSDEDLAFRKLIDGKAYYSSDPAEGVSRNPTKQFISGVGNVLNRAAQRAQNPEAASLGDLFDSLRALFGEIEEEEGAEVLAYPFTYDDGVVADCDEYSIAIPDGFRLEMGKDGRDFVAWLPDGDSDEIDDARITLFAGVLNGDALAEYPDAVKSVEMTEALIEATQWKMRTQTEMFLGVSEMANIPQLGDVAGSYMYNSSNYQIMVGFPDGVKQLRVLIGDIFANRETYHQAVVDWVGTLRLKKKFSPPTSLNSDGYMPLNEECLARWKTDMDNRKQRAEMIGSMRVNARVARYEYEARDGNPSITLLKRDLRQILQGILVFGEDTCESAVEFWERVCNDGNEDARMLSKLRELITDSIDNLDDETIEVVSERKAELKSRVAVAAEKAEAAQAERARREREARRAAEERIIGPARQAYNDGLAAAERIYRAEREKREDAIAGKEAEIGRLKATLPSFTSMQLAKKGQVRAQIANLEREVGMIKQELNDLLVAYEEEKTTLKHEFDAAVQRAGM